MEIEFYETLDGKTPVIEFMDGLQPKQAQKVAWTLRVVERLNPVPAVYLKKLVNTADLWEVRVSFAGNIFRLLGWQNVNGELMLAHGFTKKAQAIPEKEIAVTEARKRDYENRKKKRC